MELGLGSNQVELRGKFPCVAIVLHHLLKQIPSQVVISSAMEILHLIESSNDDSFDQVLFNDIGDGHNHFYVLSINY